MKLSDMKIKVMDAFGHMTFASIEEITDCVRDSDKGVKYDTTRRTVCKALIALVNEDEIARTLAINTETNRDIFIFLLADNAEKMGIRGVMGLDGGTSFIDYDGSTERHDKFLRDYVKDNGLTVADMCLLTSRELASKVYDYAKVVNASKITKSKLRYAARNYLGAF